MRVLIRNMIGGGITSQMFGRGVPLKPLKHGPFQPRHDKTNKVTVCPAKTQIILGIRPVWSESSLCAKWVAKDISFLHADSKDSAQTGRMPRLISVFAWRTVILLVLSCRGPFFMILKELYLAYVGAINRLRWLWHLPRLSFFLFQAYSTPFIVLNEVTVYLLLVRAVRKA